MNISNYQKAWDSQGEGRNRTIPVGEDVEGGFCFIWKRVGILSANRKRPIFLLK